MVEQALKRRTVECFVFEKLARHKIQPSAMFAKDALGFGAGPGQEAFDFEVDSPGCLLAAITLHDPSIPLGADRATQPRMRTLVFGD